MERSPKKLKIEKVKRMLSVDPYGVSDIGELSPVSDPAGIPNPPPTDEMMIESGILSIRYSRELCHKINPLIGHILYHNSSNKNTTESVDKLIYYVGELYFALERIKHSNIQV